MEKIKYGLIVPKDKAYDNLLLNKLVYGRQYYYWGTDLNIHQWYTETVCEFFEYSVYELLQDKRLHPTGKKYIQNIVIDSIFNGVEL